jgi:mannonate dehydratase
MPKLPKFMFGKFRPAWRHYFSGDQVSLVDIVHTGVRPTIVSALDMTVFDKPWTVEAIAAQDAEYAKYGLSWEIVESVPVSDAIKLGLPERDQHIEVFLATCRNLASASPKKTIVTINAMLGPDWMRTNMAKPFEGHSGYEAPMRLGFDFEEMAKIDLTDPNFTDVPAAWPNYDSAKMAETLKRGQELGVEKYWANLEYFLAKVVPALKEMGLELAIHPDDPPFEIIPGVPRILQSREDFERILSYGDSDVLKLCACVGSYASGTKMDAIEMVEHFGNQRRISWYHLRNVTKRYGESGELLGFDESWHHDGDIDFLKLADTIHDLHEELGIPAIGRSDHGPDLRGEGNLPGARRGYTYTGRAQGLLYLCGLFETAEKS